MGAHWTIRPQEAFEELAGCFRILKNGVVGDRHGHASKNLRAVLISISGIWFVKGIIAQGFDADRFVLVDDGLVENKII
jgi:hypothetical protein